VNWELVGPISEVETIAVGNAIRDLVGLGAQYGPGRWRKLKGIGTVRVENGDLYRAEQHWYEAHGVGRRIMRLKRLIEE
jgi:hypothetical protein